MSLSILSILIPGLFLQYPFITSSEKVFFNGSSQLQVLGATIPLNNGFDFSFRTCHGGVLLSQTGTNGGFFILRVVQTSVNYSMLPPKLISSHLQMSWKISRNHESVSLGDNLDRNVLYKVTFKPGSGGNNSTLELNGLDSYIAEISNSILGFKSSGPLYAGIDLIGNEEGFVGCMESGRNIVLTVSSDSVMVKKNCSLDYQLGCSRKSCSPGLTGYYCETNIDDCASQPCHHYSTCIDVINNYTCNCGPRWSGRHCNTYLGSPCNVSNINVTEICKNGGICHETNDKNNYTCACTAGFTGRNCEARIDPCASSPCEQGGTCSKFLDDDFQCNCPQGFTGKNCSVNIDDCFTTPCSLGFCVDGINNYTCNCTGSGYTGSRCSQDIDECDTIKPCNPNGSCINYAGTYQCNCPPGFTGKNCYENINDCANNPCKNGGSCRDLVDGFICKCLVGFNGTYCEHNIDDCVSHQCNNFSNCLDGINNYTCVCKPGYTGINCTSDIDECNSSPCQNGGSCTHGINWYNCTCPPRYNGSNCEFDAVDDCIGDPCANNATCVDGFNQFNCTCAPGFEGLRCENETDECLSAPCLNNGTCTDQFNNFTCNCTAGFTGHACAENIDDCLSAPCKNNATCNDGINEYSCTCAMGFYGDDCENVRDACHPSPCNNGTCSIVGDSYNCTCFSGFEGVNCTVNIDECKNDSCVANATCVDGINNFTCQCPLGYRGDYCQIEIDECGSNPCMNNGSCTDAVGGYNCSCLEGFNGTRCENNIDDCPSQGCNNGTCIDGINNFTCQCYSGFTGLSCESDINECLGISCNTGTCVNFPGSYRCDCDQWTTGAYCESDIDECKTNNPCNPNGGICVNCDGSSQSTPPPCTDNKKGFGCFCRDGFTGPNCGINVNECRQYNPCVNGATCVDKVADYSCVCAPGYTGRNCSVEINECEFGFCQNGASCHDFINGYNCTCVAGYTDYNCSTNIDECEGNPCEHGNCTDMINDFNCTCLPGYTGRNCSINIDECASLPCQNNGTCQDLVAAFNCSCAANYTGEFCEHEISSCLPENPCLNNGSCVEKDFNYTCDCVPGYGGRHCENITTIGLNGSSYVSFSVQQTVFTLSFQFRTTLGHGILVADTANRIVVFLDQRTIHVLYNGTGKVSAGFKANLTNGDWHRVVVNMSTDVIILQVDNASCGEHCESFAALPSVRPLITHLFIGGSPQTLSLPLAILHNFTGCIQDVAIDNRTVIPTEVGVELWNSSIGCPRAQVCDSKPCVNGRCVDEWIRYSCECTRPWVGSDCNTSLIPGTFGATEPLNNMHSRRRRDVETVRNASYAKFLTNDAIFGSNTEFSFFIRTREFSGLIAFMTNGIDEHISVGLVQGAVVFQVTSPGLNSNVSLSGNVSDGQWHFVQIKGNMSMIDNQSHFIGSIVNKDVRLNVTFIGGLSDFSSYPGAAVVRSPFRGCIQDMRLNNKLFDYGFDPTFSPPGRYSLLEQSNLGEGCSGINVCRTLPCGQGGYCKDLWNKYKCDCKPRYGGRDCSLYGCALVNLCPDNTTCLDVNEHYECVYPATFNGTATRAEFTPSYTDVIESLVSLRMRTRQSSTDLILVQTGNDFFRVGVNSGRVNVSFELEGNDGEVSSGVLVNDGKWHTVMLNVTSSETQLIVDGSNASSTGHHDRLLNDLLNGSTVLVGGHSVLKGCLDNVRMGGLLLPFVDYYNSSINVSHITPQPPQFRMNFLGLRLGCHSDDVCGARPCVRGVCGDIWNQFTCACPEGWAGTVCNLTANMTCAHSPCANGTCVNVTEVTIPTNESQVSDVGYDMFYCNCTPGFEGKQCKNKTNECSSNPCENGANCTDLHLNYTCVCVVGYTGRNCETDIDDCESHNCSNHATCIDGVNHFNCSCVNGFEGKYCEKDVNECLMDPPPFGPCNASGTTNCTNGFGNFTCDCKKGYFGDLCQFDPSLACISNPCKNGGTCQANETGFNCTCPAGYNGTFCQFDIRKCKDEPCMNNGTCMDSLEITSEGHFVSYNCTCTVDYEGRRCEDKIDPCNLYPCKNNASCERLTYNKYACNCTPAYGGENCTVFLPCYSSPCRNGGTCNPLITNYTCSCALGYKGPNCEEVVDYCYPDPCTNNASCVNMNTLGKYYCNCTEGYGNVNCSGLLKYCLPDNPCVHGTCIPLIDRYQCVCNAGYQGQNCSELVNKCDSNPCMNGGTCNPENDSYVCSCLDDWVGSQCNIDNACQSQPCENSGTCEVDELLGNYTCLCRSGFTGEVCETSLEATEPGEQKDGTPAGLIIGIVAASLLLILLVILVIVFYKKRSGNGTYSPSKQEVEGGRVELDAILKPPPPERLI